MEIRRKPGTRNQNSFIQEIVMYVRNTATAFIAAGLLALSTTATASPLPPDPPSRHTTSTVQMAIDQLKGESSTHSVHSSAESAMR